MWYPDPLGPYSAAVIVLGYGMAAVFVHTAILALLSFWRAR